VAERKLSCIAAGHVPSAGHYGPEQNFPEEMQCVGIGHKSRKQGRQGEQCQDARQTQCFVDEAGISCAHSPTLSEPLTPNNPTGRTSSTRRKTMKYAICLISEPMKKALRFSIRPIATPPIRAPQRLPMPPSTTMMKATMTRFSPTEG